MGIVSLLEKFKDIVFMKMDRLTFLKIIVVIAAALFFQTYTSNTAMADWDPSSPDLQSERFRGDPYLEAVYDGESSLSIGMERESVRTLQQALMDLGYSIPDGPTLFFGDQTKEAVIAYQNARGLEDNGIVDSTTMKSLDHSIFMLETLPTQTPEPAPTSEPIQTPAREPTPEITKTPAPSGGNGTPSNGDNTLLQIIGVLLVIAGLLFTSLTTLKKDTTIEIGMSEKTLKYVGGTGVLLVIIGAFILLESTNSI